MIRERDALIRERNALIEERDALIGERDALIREAQRSVAAPGSSAKALSDLELIGLLPVELPRRAVVNGFPGAGNVLAERICSALLRNSGLSNEQPRIRGGNQTHDEGSRIERAFGSRLTWLLSRLPAALPRDRVWESFFSHGATGSVVFVAIHDPDFLLVSGLELNAYINTAVHATHELPSRGSYAFYAEQSLEILPVVRHPLDILVSFASKLSLSLAQRVSTAAATAGISPRDIVCRARLASDTWLFDYATLLRRFYEPIAEMAGHWGPVRYEDALEDPVGYVAALARRLSVGAANDVVAGIAGMINHQEFDPGHFNRPAIGKWRRHLSARQIQLLRPTGLFEVFSAFGYEDQSTDGSLGELQASNPVQIPVASRSPIDPLRDHQYLGLAGTFDPEELIQLLHLDGAVYTLRHGHHVLAGSDRVLLCEYSARLISLLTNELRQSDLQ